MLREEPSEFPGLGSFHGRLKKLNADWAETWRGAGSLSAFAGK
jgi:hypothetical protein